MKKNCCVKDCEKVARFRGMCLKHYDRAIHAKTIPVIQPKGLPIHERISQRCRLNELSGCVEWMGSKNEKGYGLIGVNGVTRKTHRVVWEMAHGNIPQRVHVLHRCDNRACVNIEHLFIGTHDDNMADMNAKGRQISHKGEEHGCAKLTEEQVRGIRRDARVYREIANTYGVSESLIGMIKNHRIWKHVA